MVRQSHPLFASYEKVKRAEAKFRQLVALVNAYVASNPYSIRIERDAKFTHVIGCLDRDPPDEIMFELVEAVNHLRAALDKLVVELAILNGGSGSGVGFPFVGMNNGKPEAFPSNRMLGNGGISKKLSANAWTLIQRQKPYPGGNDTLWAINEIANSDKHRSGLVSVLPHESDTIGLRNGYFADLIIRPMNHDVILRDKERETVLMSIGHGGRNQEIDRSATISVVFGELMPVTGKNVLVTLNQQIRLVEGVLNTFRAAFF